ncbi:MAG TPA: transporter substrate-binding domain-containing protein [Candidatus Competibacter sp.]|nr:transporter substrate-binding domain-containing protein [Candidatus Competibacter sp.]
MKKLLIHLLTGVVVGLASNVATAQVLTVSFGDNYPYSIPEGRDGITYDVLRQTLGQAGYQIEPVYVPYERRFRVFQEKNLDVVVEARPESVALYKLDGFLSVPAIRFDNFAIHLKKNKLKITRTSDLAAHRVISWQGARNVMGDEYAAMVKRNNHYQENSKQRAQVMMLFSDRADILHIDITIFAYWRNQVGKTTDIDVWQDVEMYHFGDIYFNFLFRDEKVRDLFNEKFKELQDSGQYAKIYQKYTVLESRRNAR